MVTPSFIVASLLLATFCCATAQHDDHDSHDPTDSGPSAPAAAKIPSYTTHPSRSDGPSKSPALFFPTSYSPSTSDSPSMASTTVPHHDNNNNDSPSSAPVVAVVVADWFVDAENGRVRERIVYQNKIFLALTDDRYGSELWVYDDQQGRLRLFMDLLPGTGSSSPAFLTTFQDRLYFVTTGWEFAERGLWVTDGTPSGTQLVYRTDHVSTNFDGIFPLLQMDGYLYLFTDEELVRIAGDPNYGDHHDHHEDHSHDDVDDGTDESVSPMHSSAHHS